MERELSQEELKVLEKVGKLLALAGNNSNEAEASSAAQKAQDMLAAYNLSMFQVERNSGTAKRSDSYLKGGLYKWQRELWNEVSRLNFCMYWFQRGLTKGSQYKHRILGRPANVKSTQVMSEYLQEAIERLAREWAGEPTMFFTKSAISYREGMAHRVIEKLKHRRWAQEEEDRKRKAEETARRSHPSYAGTGTALVVLDDVRRAEQDANYDYLYGEGYSARQRADRAAAEAAYEKAMAERKAWEEANPEEVARRKIEADKYQAALDKKEAARAKRRKGSLGRSSPSYKGDLSAYHAGHRKGGEIGIDTQISNRKDRAIG